MAAGDKTYLYKLSGMGWDKEVFKVKTNGTTEVVIGNADTPLRCLTRITSVRTQFMEDVGADARTVEAIIADDRKSVGIKLNGALADAELEVELIQVQE